MLYKKSGIPEENEIVMCTVQNVQHHSVFAILDEYQNLRGMIHISEVSPGRIRNIRDFVKEGKKVVCKILRVDRNKGHIDLSLRRVTEMQKRNKVEEIKKIQKSEKILDNVAYQLKTDLKTIYEKISPKIFERYENLYEFFEDISIDSIKAEEIIDDKKIASLLDGIVRERIKPKSVQIGGTIKLSTFEPDGVEIIKAVLKKVSESDKSVVIKYVGGGLYSISVDSSNYKDAEKSLEESIQLIEDSLKGKKATFDFKRK